MGPEDGVIVETFGACTVNVPADKTLVLETFWRWMVTW
jgi:hypothetical protein